jgi:hypothetical protein
MKTAKILMTGAMLLAATPALADDAAPPPPTPAASSAAPAATAAAGPATKLWVGGGLELVPIGTVSGSNGIPDQGTDTGLYGIDVTALYVVHPMVAVGLAPRYLLNMKSSGQTDSSSMYDIRVVGVAHKELAPKISGFGLLGLGYASISLPSSMGMSPPSPAGMTLSLEAGAGYAITPKLIGTFGLGYEFGFESASVQGMNFDSKFNHLSISLGILAGVM